MVAMPSIFMMDVTENVWERLGCEHQRPALIIVLPTQIAISDAKASMRAHTRDKSEDEESATDTIKLGGASRKWTTQRSVARTVQFPLLALGSNGDRLGHG